MDFSERELADKAGGPKEAAKMLTNIFLLTKLGKKFGAHHLKSIKDDLTAVQYEFYRLAWLLKFGTDEMKREGAKSLVASNDETYSWFGEHALRSLNSKSAS